MDIRSRESKAKFIVPEELQGEVLGFIDDPDRQEVLAVQIGDPRLEVPPDLRASVGRFQM
jgi:hypothetical protein